MVSVSPSRQKVAYHPANFVSGLGNVYESILLCVGAAVAGAMKPTKQDQDDHRADKRNYHNLPRPA
jgi:hypothetical protein